ncbi:hypothetical protein ABK040_014031 [Willaertia magna]
MKSKKQQDFAFVNIFFDKEGVKHTVSTRPITFVYNEMGFVKSNQSVLHFQAKPQTSCNKNSPLSIGSSTTKASPSMQEKEGLVKVNKVNKGKRRNSLVLDKIEKQTKTKDIRSSSILKAVVSETIITPKEEPKRTFRTSISIKELLN